MSLEFALSIAAVFLVGSGIRIAPEGTRMIVIRRGGPGRVLGPGLHFVLPLIHSVARVPLDATLPAWRDLPEAEITQRLLHMARAGALES